MKNLVVISAPSGTGKTTLCRALQKTFAMEFSVSCTTRTKRTYEEDGIDYHFIEEKTFLQRVEHGDFVETENVHGYYYGTLKETIDQAILNGNIMLFEVDVKGAMSIKNHYTEETISIFVLPPSIDDLKARLIKRGTDSEERIAKRLKRLNIEIGYKEKFDIIIINDNIDRASEEIIKIIEEQNQGVLHGS